MRSQLLGKVSSVVVLLKEKEKKDTEPPGLAPSCVWQ